MKNHLLLALTVPAVAFMLTACQKSAPPEPSAAPPLSNAQTSADPKSAVAVESKAVAPAPSAPSSSAREVLVFRNVRSWRRKVDFEEALSNLGFKFEVKPSIDMQSTDLMPYRFVIIPGAQWQDDFYHDYAANAARFDGYVTNGGTLILELNGAERDGITLPGGASMVKHGATENVITLPEHPAIAPLAGKPIHANYASHGYLEAVPKNALVLVTEAAGEQPDTSKPTFIEYAHGGGRVIAACQCFHDQDGSGRGPLMDSVISYAAEKQWFSPLK